MSFPQLSFKVQLPCSRKCIKAKPLPALHSSYIFPCAFFAIFKVLLGAAVVLGHAWSHRHWLQDLCYPLEVSFSPAVLSHPSAAAPACQSPPLLTAHLCRMKPQPCTHTTLPLPWEAGTGAAQEELGAACPCRDLGMAISRPCPSAGTELRSPCLWDTSSKVHRAVPACRESLQLLRGTGLFQGPVPLYRSCPCSGQGTSGFEGAGLSGSALHTQKRVQQCRTRGAGTGWERFPARGRSHIPCGWSACAARSFPGALYPWSCAALQWEGSPCLREMRWVGPGVIL